MAQAEEEAVRRAAVLTAHWLNRDIEAIVMLLDEWKLDEDAQDLLICLLLLRDRDPADVHRVINRSIWESA